MTPEALAELQSTVAFDHALTIVIGVVGFLLAATVIFIVTVIPGLISRIHALDLELTHFRYDEAAELRRKIGAVETKVKVLEGNDQAALVALRTVQEVVTGELVPDTRALKEAVLMRSRRGHRRRPVATRPPRRSR